MSDSTTLPPTHIDTTIGPVNEDNMADALSLGHKTAENSRLILPGKLALLETSSILPNYKQLRFLDGRSGIATFIIAVQAIGYVTSTAYRATYNLPVSPIEAIGFPFSMLVIVRSLFYIMGVICQNPLVIYLNRTQEQEMLEKCRSTRWSNRDDQICIKVSKVVASMVACVVRVFTAHVARYTLSASSLDAIGPILFFFSIIPQVFLAIYLEGNSSPWGVFLLCFGSVMISLGGIVVSIVATTLNWQTNKFDSRTPSVYLPFLG
jgi:uncharacterized protein with PQ loop repeat